jgi:hypothetical protein
MGDRSHTLSALVVCQPTAHLVMPPYMPLVASMPWGTLAPVESALEVRGTPGADDASLGAVKVEAHGASP